MNPYVLGLLAMFVRYGIVAIAGAIGMSPELQAWVDQNVSQWTQLSMAIAGGLATVGYAVLRKFLDKQKLVQALQIANVSEKTVEVMVKDKFTETPSVLAPKHEVPS